MIVRRATALRVALFALVVLGVCVPVGRWQDRRALAAERAKIEHIEALVAPIGSRTATAYRLAAYDCLLYPIGPDPYAIELCFDRSGRLVEAIDRRHVGFPPKVGTLRYDPAGSPILVPPARLLDLLHRAGALHGIALSDGRLPGPFADLGPTTTRAGIRLLTRH